VPRLTAETSIEAKKASTAPIIFIRVLNIPHRDGSGSTSVYLCDAGEFVSFFDENGDPEAYIPVGIEFDRIEQDNTTRMVNFRVRIDNVSRDFCALANQGIIDGCRIEILRGYRALLSDVSYAQPLIQGIIQSWRITEATIELEVTSAIGLFQKVPRRLCWSRCQWQFKGDICRANAEATTCGKTLEDCKRFYNVRRFGGFPYIEKSRDPRQIWTRV